MGYTGQGVVVMVLDDGIEANHTDLQKNYVTTCCKVMKSNDQVLLYRCQN